VQKRWLCLAFATFVATASACNTADLKQPAGSSGEATSGGPEVPGEDGETPTADGGRAPGTGADGGVIPTSSKVTIQVQPSDFGAQIKAAIRAAKTSVHMTMYLLTDSSIIDALGDLKDAGKDVKVVLNQTFPPNGGDNGPSFTQLKARGVNVVYAPSAYTFTHAKTVIIDNATALIMTMNLTYTSAKDNREYIATDSDPADVADCEKLFAADFSGAAVTENSNLVLSPQATSTVDARARLKALIDSAKTSLDVEVQSLSDDALTDAIVLAHQAKVAVRVVISASNEDTPAEKDSIAKLKAAGVPFVGVVTPYIHAKAIVVDGTKVFVGSQNFTPTALFKNREIGVVTDAAGEATKVRDVIAKDFAAGTPL
jgi:phosphatidylserine/phosphatidylglycerophosphate/cardiolipin synthase-like enzyme